MPEYGGIGRRRLHVGLYAELGNGNGRLLNAILLKRIAHLLPAHLHRPLVSFLHLGLPVSILRVLVVSALLERMFRHPRHAVPRHLAHLLLDVAMVVIVAMIMGLYLWLLVLLTVRVLLVLLMLNLLVLELMLLLLRHRLLLRRRLRRLCRLRLRL